MGGTAKQAGEGQFRWLTNPPCLGGAIERPVYAILQMNRSLSRVRFPEGYSLQIFSTHQPFDTSKYAMKWDGDGTSRTSVPRSRARFAVADCRVEAPEDSALLLTIAWRQH